MTRAVQKGPRAPFSHPFGVPECSRARTGFHHRGMHHSDIMGQLGEQGPRIEARVDFLFNRLYALRPLWQSERRVLTSVVNVSAVEVKEDC